MLECLPDPRFKDDYSHHLANIYATCEDPDDYTINTETDSIDHSDVDALLKDLRDNCDMSKDENKESIIFLRNEVLENVKERVKSAEEEETAV